MRGLDALEFGCGACQFGIKVAMRGARVAGLDSHAPSCVTAGPSMAETGVRFPRRARPTASSCPFADERFDLVFCDHGVMTFADPLRHRPGGRARASPRRPVRVQHGDAVDLGRLGRDRRAARARAAPRPTSGMRRARSGTTDWTHDRVPADVRRAGSGCSARTASRSRT